MKFQMTIGAQFCILISLLIIGACVHKSDSFSMDIVHNKEGVYFEQNLFSKGSYPYLMGHPAWKIKRNTTFKFTFQLDDISSLYYGYLSIESWDVEHAGHKILLNEKEMSQLPISTSVDFGPTFSNDTPTNLEDTQIYVPKRFFKNGQNTLEIKALILPNKMATDSFAIGRLDIVVVNVKSGRNYVENGSRNKKKKKYFPKKLQFFTKLTDEELFISTVQLPQLFTELNLGYGIYRKKLSFIYSKIGEYHRWRGGYAKNLKYQEKAIETELKEGYTSLIPFLRANLGLAQYYIGDYDLSIDTCKQAIKELKKVDQEQLKKISPTQLEDINSLKNLINAYISLNYYHLEKYELAEQFCHKVYWGLPLAIAIKARVLGNINTKRRNLQKATDYYRQAIASLNQNPQIYHDPILNNKLCLANAFYLQGNYKEATSIISEVENPTHEFKWRSHMLLGDIQQAENKIEKAISQYIQSTEEIELSRAKLNSHGFKISFMNDKQEPYRKAISSLVKADRSKEAFNYVEKAKARAFLDLIASAKNVAYRKNAKLKELSDKEKHLRKKLIDLQNRIDAEQKMFKERGVNEETKIKLENARSALQNFYKTTATKNEYFASLSTVDTLTMPDLMKLIPDGVSLVEYYYDPNHLYIWVLDNKRHHFFKKDVYSSELENLTKEYRNLVFEDKDLRSIKITKRDEQRIADSKNRFRQVNDALESILLDGVIDHIKTHKVYIVPHGILHYLPFQTLTYHSHYLIEKYQIGYIPSATALKYVLAKRKEKSANILALGNPELNSAQMQLPFAEKEVQSIKTIYPTTKVLIGEDASEANFKKQAGAYDILHVASHGEFNPTTPLLSSLRLSGGDGEDGRLETREIFGLNLDAYLVTLSACNTAIGKLTKGDDVVGLTRAFIFAGTPSILGTIWSVNDESTSIFMNHFYGNLKEMDKLQSLQQAQIAMIRSDKYSNLYHWAGFQLIGDYY